MSVGFLRDGGSLRKQCWFPQPVPRPANASEIFVPRTESPAELARGMQSERLILPIHSIARYESSVGGYAIQRADEHAKARLCQNGLCVRDLGNLMS